jgi:deoxycytidylate deaminase
MGAVIVKGSRVLSTASNRVNRGCRLIKEKKWKNSLHAEAYAILKLLKKGRLADLAHADLYVTRINRVGHCMDSKPCEFCLDLANSVGIKRIYYTNAQGVLSCV